MVQRIIDEIGHLIHLFDTAQENANCRVALRVWNSVMKRMDDLNCVVGMTEGQKRAHAQLQACGFLLECWATLGFRKPFRIARALLERAMFEMIPVTEGSNGMAACDRVTPALTPADWS